MLEGKNYTDREGLCCDREERAGGAFEISHDMLLR